MTTDLVEIEVTRSYLKTVTVVVSRSGRSDDELLSAYENEIEEGLASATMNGGEDFFEIRDGSSVVTTCPPKIMTGYLIRVKENGKLIGSGPGGQPSCVDKYAQWLMPYGSAQLAQIAIESMSGWTLYNLGPVSDFTYEFVPVNVILGE